MRHLRINSHLVCTLLKRISYTCEENDFDNPQRILAGPSGETKYFMTERFLTVFSMAQIEWDVARLLGPLEWRVYQKFKSGNGTTRVANVARRLRIGPTNAYMAISRANRKLEKYGFAKIEIGQR